MQELALTREDNTDLQKLGVEALVLFGSRAQGVGSDHSDYDIGVLVASGHAIAGSDQRRELYDAIYELLSCRIQQLVDIDIVFLRDAPMELQSHVAKYGVVLYASDQTVFVRFREHVMNLYADFASIRHMFHQAILNRISL